MVPVRKEGLTQCGNRTVTRKRKMIFCPSGFLFLKLGSTVCSSSKELFYFVVKVWMFPSLKK